MTGRSHNVAAQATTLGKRFATAADELLVALRAARGPARPLPAARDQGPGRHRARTCSTCSTATPTRLAELEQRVAEHLGFDRVLHQRRPGLPALARLRRGRPRWCSWRPAPSILATTIRLMAGHELVTEGFQPGPGRLVGDAAQDEHPLLRARQRARGGAARLPLDGRRAGRRPVERGRRVLLGRAPGRAAGRVLRRSTGCSRRS